MKLSPLIKGVITALLMTAVSLLTYYTVPAGSPLHYIVFAVYAAGIIWTVTAHKKAAGNSARFGDYFNAGFRCFIVAILLTAVYTYTFNKLHPEFAAEAAAQYKEQLSKENVKTPEEISKAAERYKKGYAMALVYGSIFGYLIIGAAVTAASSAILTSRK